MEKFWQEYGLAIGCFGMIAGIMVIVWLCEVYTGGFKDAWKRVWRSFF